MHRIIGVAGAAGYVAAQLVVALSTAGPARAQVLTDPAAVAATPAGEAPATPGAAEEAPRSEPAAPAAAAPYAPASAEPAAATVPVVVDPILEEVRQQLAQPARGAVDRADRA